jgi:hypothetical protein
MSLLTELGINGFCPPVSHDHRIAIAEDNTHLSECALCSYDVNLRTEFNWICKDYYTISFHKLEDNSLQIARKCLYYNYLPNEIIEKIISYTNYYTKTIITPIPIIVDSLRHIVTCIKCSENLLLWINKNTCDNHALPRYALINGGLL